MFERGGHGEKQQVLRKKTGFFIKKIGIFLKIC